MTVAQETQDLLERFRAVLPKARERGKVISFEEACRKYPPSEETWNAEDGASE